MAASNPFENTPNPDSLHGLTRIAPPGPNPILDRWCAWHQAIDDDLTDVAFTRYVWRAEQGLLAAHDDMPASDIFHVRARNYGIAQATAIRRQVDTDRDSITLATLLTDIATHAEVMTPDRYAGRANGCNHKPCQYTKAGALRYYASLSMRDRDFGLTLGLRIARCSRGWRGASVLG